MQTSQGYPCTNPDSCEGIRDGKVAGTLGTAGAVDQRLCEQPGAPFSSDGSFVGVFLLFLFFDFFLFIFFFFFFLGFELPGCWVRICKVLLLKIFLSVFLHAESMVQGTSNALYTPSLLGMTWPERLHCWFQALPSAFGAGRALSLSPGNILMLRVIEKRSSFI